MRRHEIERWGLALFCSWEALCLISGHEKLHPWSHLAWRYRHTWTARTVIGALIAWLLYHLFLDAQDRYPYPTRQP